MSPYHFISYSRVDAQDCAIRLCDELEAGSPSIQAWLDKRKMKPGQHWDDQIVEAIRNCKSLIFIMTCDSVKSLSLCKNEYARAMKYKKPIIPILLHADAELPFQLENRQYIDFTSDFHASLAQLRNHLQWLDSPEGQLQALKDRLMDAQRALQIATDPDSNARILDEIALLKKQMDAQEQVITDPEGTALRVQESIDRGLERERRPLKPISGERTIRFINPPPGIAPNYFQDRTIETKLIADFLKDDAVRLMTVVGRAGIGKTAMVCRLLKYLETECCPMTLDHCRSKHCLSMREWNARSQLCTLVCRSLPAVARSNGPSIAKDLQKSEDRHHRQNAKTVVGIPGRPGDSPFG